MTASISEFDREPARVDVPTVPDAPIITLDQVMDYVGRDVFVKTAVASAKVGTTKGGKPFVSMTVVDRTDEVEMKVWGCSELPAEVGAVVGFRAKADEFNGAPQLVLVGRMKPLPDEDPADFVRASHMTRESLEEQLAQTLKGLRGDVGSIARLIFSDPELRDAFLDAPAAIRNHHAYARGLAEHTLSMTIAAGHMVSHYAFFYDDPIDRDLVIAGVLLHDVGKVLEYERAALTWETSIEGELVGHIPACAALINDAAMAVAADDGVRLRLLHIVLSHHGQKQWGSPVEPKTLEAQIVHHVDMLDSRLGMMREALRGVSDGEASEWVRPLGGRVVR